MSLVSVLCALVAGLALAYAVEEWRRLRSNRLLQFVSPGQARRRIVGSLLAVALMVLVDLGLEVIEPTVSPVAFLLVWSVAIGLVFALLALAFLDLREVRANEEIERARVLMRLGRQVGEQARERGDGGARGGDDSPG